jgi:hypothetical protein
LLGSATASLDAQRARPHRPLDDELGPLGGPMTLPQSRVLVLIAAQ